MGRNKKFAKNPEEVRHFKLVARSQNDRDAEDAAPLVLEPFAPLGAQRRSGLSEAELLQIPESLQGLGPETFGLPNERSAREASSGSRQRREEEEEDDDDACLDDELDGDCYFPKDGYDYEQHLKKVSGGKRGGVVGVVMEAPINERTRDIAVLPEDIAMQAATNEDEAEVLRALQHADEYEELDDEEFEDILPTGPQQPELLLWGPAALQDNHLPDLALFRRPGANGDGGYRDDDDCEEMEGQTGPGGEAMATAEEFERFFKEEYGDDDDAACEDEEIEGPVALENCEAVLDEYIEGKEAECKKLFSIYEPQEGKLDDVPRVIEETKAIIEKHYMAEGGDEETSSGEDSEDEDESRNWDCETVLSTLSNVSNRPGKIGKIKVVKKPAPPLKPVKESGGAGSDEEEEEDEVVELPDVVTERPKGETPEERKLRKASVKEMRRVCRKMKKESKEMYKSEAAKLTKGGTGDVRSNARHFRL